MKGNKTLYDYCLEQEKFQLLAQWDKGKNGSATPKTVTYGSARKVWWRCDQGHEWETTVYSRAIKESNCPYCAGLRVLPGKNDLESTYPELAMQWHPTKNGDLRPCDVAKTTQKEVWWLCDQGHEWKTKVFIRTMHGSGCPVCAGKVLVFGKNDLQSNFPEVAKQWHPTLNGELTPENVMQFSSQKVWWVCERGHEYSAAVARRTKQGTGCPYCANKKVLAGFNDLATRNPEVARQWHPTLNGELTPEQILAGSVRKVWWQCSLGHEWKARVSSRAAASRKTGCPGCAGVNRRKKTEKYGQILAEEKNKLQRE